MPSLKDILKKMKQPLRTYVYLVEVEQEEDGRWSATVPALTGCAAWGSTRSGALDAVKEAAEAYLLTLAEDGRLPAEPGQGQIFDGGPLLALRV